MEADPNNRDPADADTVASGPATHLPAAPLPLQEPIQLPRSTTN